MKTLSVKIFCCSYKLHKVGLLVGVTHLITSLLIIIYEIVTSDDNFLLTFMCGLTVPPSVYLIKGLIQERHELLLPWLINTTVLFIYNIIFITVESCEVTGEETKQSSDLKLAFIFVLELQISCWYIVYCLYKTGYQKKRRLIAKVQDKYYICLVESEYLIDSKNVISI